jgi:alkylation response protein AidB-like acyl-CoA dehydrogenase
LTSDHEAMREALRDLLAQHCTPQTVRDAAAGTPARLLWHQLNEMGALAAGLSVDAGGAGLDGVGLALLAEQCGYVSLPAPFVEHAGVVIPALADADVDVAEIHCAIPVLAHHMSTVPWAEETSHLLIEHDDGLALFDRGSVILRSAGDTLDESRPVTTVVVPDGAQGRHIGGIDSTAKAFDRGALGTAAQLIGLGRRMLDMSLRHALDRHQFGVPIGSFQAVKHRLAEARTALEYATSLVYAGAWTLDHRPHAAALAVSMAKANAGDAAHTIGRTALQCHGAMGYSEEFDLQLFLKRTWALNQSWGAIDWHRRRISKALAKETPDEY